MRLVICLFAVTCIMCNSLYLTNENYRLIVKLIKTPSLTILQRKSINKILYNSYENWAVSKALEFKQIHNYKCKDINPSELILSSKYGLYKSIIKYNGKISFTNFSNIYLLSELYKVVTDRYSLSMLPKSHRIKNKKNFTKRAIIQYKKLVYTESVSIKNMWQIDKTHSENTIVEKIYHNDRINDFWNIVNNNLHPFMKRVFYLKYNYEFTKIRSNKIISELMCCSEENIRITLSKGFIIIREMLLQDRNIILEATS